MKRITSLFAATLFVLSLTGIAFSEETKKDDATSKDEKSDKKDTKKDKKDTKKDTKKEDEKPAKKKKESAGC